jgi:hypothetical protein
LGYVIVLLLAALAGGIVYWASMRFARSDEASPSGAWDTDARSEGTNGGEGSPPVASAGTAYIPVTESRGSWQGRLGGVMGLVIAVVAAAATTAFVLYEAGHIISKLLSGAANNG